MPKIDIESYLKKWEGVRVPILLRYLYDHKTVTYKEIEQLYLSIPEGVGNRHKEPSTRKNHLRYLLIRLSERENLTIHPDGNTISWNENYIPLDQVLK